MLPGGIHQVQSANVTSLIHKAFRNQPRALGGIVLVTSTFGETALAEPHNVLSIVLMQVLTSFLARASPDLVISNDSPQRRQIFRTGGMGAFRLKLPYTTRGEKVLRAQS